MSFSSLGCDDIKLEIFQYVHSVQDYLRLSFVSTEWRNLLQDNYLWKPLFLRDFGSWKWKLDSVEMEQEQENQEESEHAEHPAKKGKIVNRIGHSSTAGFSWKEKYKQFHVKGNQWDPDVKNGNVELLNENFTAMLLEGSSYHGARALKPLKMGENYFEVLVEGKEQKSTTRKHDTKECYFSVGLASSQFNVESCPRGWTATNNGIGYYNTGSLFVMSSHSYSKWRLKIRTGDRFGIKAVVAEHTCDVVMYHNGEAITDSISIPYPENGLWPYAILCNSSPYYVSIFSCIQGYPRCELTDLQKARKLSAIGKDHYRKKEFKEAISYFVEALSIKPNWKTCYKWKGKAHQRLEEWDTAIHDLTKCIELNPVNANSYLVRGFLYEAMKKIDKEGYLHKAIEDYNKAIELDPEYSSAFNNRGGVWEHLGETEKALADYAKSIELKPANPIAYKNRGDFYETQNDYEKALADYAKALQYDPNFAAVFNNRGFLYKRMEKYDSALADYTKAISLDGKDSDHFLNRAYIYEIYQDYELSLSDYAKSIELNPKNDVAFNNRANLWNSMGQYDKAIADATMAIEISPQETNSYCHRGFALYKLGKREEGLADINRSIKLHQRYARAYCFRAFIMFESNDIENALGDCQKCLSITTVDIPDVYFVRALIYKNLGKDSEAMKDLSYCLSIRHKPRVFASSLVQQELNLLQNKAE